MKVWVLKDLRIGSSKQAEFLGRALSDDVVIKNIEYNKYISLPNFIKPYKLGIDFDDSDDVLNDTEYPDIIIFSGRRLAGLAIYLKKYIYKKTKNKVKLISILNPNYSFKYFDFVILPYHDNIKYDKYNNIITINGSLCVNNLENMDKDFDFWNNMLKDYKRPFYSFMIGGDVKKKKMNPDNLLKILDTVSSYVKSKNGTLLISTSRRTNKDCVNILNDNNIKCDYYLYKWGKSSALNPYYYFVNSSDIVFLTADSISMISEIITIHKPVYAYMEDELLTKKHIKFCEGLINKKIIREIDLKTDIEDIKSFDFENINELDFVVNEIKKRL